MAYLNSSDVFVFPSVLRNRPDSRLFSEESVANLVANFINEDSFVISFDSTENGKTKFNIKGYYFEIITNSLLSNIESSKKEISASIIIGPIPDDQNNSVYTELQKTDNNSLYEGLNINYNNDFSSSERSKTTDTSTIPGKTCIEYTLVLLRRNSQDDAWYMPEGSKVRFEPSSVGLDEVDGGTW